MVLWVDKRLKSRECENTNLGFFMPGLAFESQTEYYKKSLTMAL